MHTQNSGTTDSRVGAFTNNQLSFDFSTIHWTIPKYTTRTSPLPLATYKEAQLHMAEAYAQQGGPANLASAVAIIDARHAAAGLASWTLGATATQAQVISQILDERARELFAEGGHRYNDMLRYRSTPYNIPFKGEPGSVHPNGVDQTGDVYGTTTCFPLPAAERAGNPNVS
ncbi:MAG: RagB/SusD family nutrient uptake outer membrane protein [Gemmatimonadetes bacterium]|nr:RagB/SusD family nutrient uptake outer membrane protein [Gemmatimonadota bacterium]